MTTALNTEPQSINSIDAKLSEKIDSLLNAANSVILDKEFVVKQVLACLFANGHVLIEDQPGVGKTTLIKTMAALLGLSSNRIQFTNDLLPADILGGSVFDAKTQSFKVIKGSIFSQLVFADELNRATPKTQSAFLQAMEEGYVSIEGENFDLPKPFLVLATQNPQQSTGAYPLPESQLDRFLMKIEIGIPNREAERNILMGQDRSTLIQELSPVLTNDDLLLIQKKVKETFVSENLLDYIQDLTDYTRENADLGLSPRAVLGLLNAAKAWAFIEKRNFTIPEDVKAVFENVASHRVGSIDQSKEDCKVLIQNALESVPVKD